MKSVLSIAASFTFLSGLWCQTPDADRIEALRKKIDANPSSSQNHFDLALILMRQNQLQDAASEFDAALHGDGLRTSAGWSHLYLADILEATDRHDQALAEYFAAVCTQAAGAAAANKLRRAGFSDRDLDIRCGRATSPVVVQKTDPAYTDEARIAQLEGSANIQLEVGEDGVARNFKIVQSLGLGLDENALEAVKNWRFEPSLKDGRAIPDSLTVSVDFLLKAKQSRWHLIDVGFKVPDGASRPAFRRADYPRGDGIYGRNAYEEGKLIGAIGRVASATIAFDINEDGLPANFRIEQASEDVWGPEAILVVQEWRFKPAMKNDRPVPAAGTVQLLWGPQEIDARIASGYSRLK